MSENLSRDALVSELTSAGAVFHGNTCRCPFHDDHRPSAGVFQSPNDGAWRFKCHTCDIHGDVFDIRASVRGVSLKEVLSARESETQRYSPPPEKPTPSYPSLDDLESSFPGVTNIYRYPTGDFVVFRIIDAEGKKTFRQARRDPDGWRWGGPKYRPLPLYNGDAAARSDMVVVVEGEKDTDTLRGIGIVAVTGAMGAGAAKQSDWTILAGKSVVLWPDNDDAGQKHMADVADILGKLTPVPSVCRVNVDTLRLAPKSDVSDFIANIGEVASSEKYAVIMNIIQGAQPTSPASELNTVIESAIAGQRKSLPFPWIQLNRSSAALLRQSVTVVCGTQGCGKSFFLLQAMYHLHSKGVKTSLFVLEEDRPFTLIRLLAQLEENAHLTSPDWQETYPEETRFAFSNWKSHINSFGFRVFDAPDTRPTLDDLAQWVKEQCHAGVRVIAIDPISVGDAGATPWATADKFVFEVRGALRDSGASLILAQHPKKGADINKSGLVSLDDVAGGAGFTRFTQTVFWISIHDDDHREWVNSSFGVASESSNRTIHILKARNGSGQGSRLAFELDKKSLLWKEKGLIQHDPSKSGNDKRNTA
jgi:5S rRNA maturation endonuclease (ribonuclease M5)/KaiC/GvpD/RAD55 family RecA-like ATPase